MGRKAKEQGPLAGDKRRDMGLVGFPDVSLAGAREAAREAHAKVRKGVDPVADSRALRSAMKADQAQAKTFKFCALAYVDAQEAGWRNAKHAQQWRDTLDTYAYPLIGGLLVRDIGLPHVLAVLEPIVDAAALQHLPRELREIEQGTRRLPLCSKTAVF